MRHLMSYALASLILLSQVGVPMHMHYCKGMLESVSVFVKSVCDDHQEQEALPTCCKKMVADQCPKEKDSCCDDQVKVLTQEITSLLPHHLKWVDIVTMFTSTSITDDNVAGEVISFHVPSAIEFDSGPPMYILHQSLIFYA